VKLRTAIVSLVSVGLLWWFLRHANLSDVWAEVQAADPARMLLGFLLVAATYWARAVRWQKLLEPLGHTRFRSTFRATIIGFAALGVLPARAGDVLRPYLLARQEGHSVTSAFATIVMERILDLVAVLSLLAVYVFGFADTTTMSERALQSIEASASLAAAGAGALVVVVWAMANHPERLAALTAWSTGSLPTALGGRIATAVEHFGVGLSVARTPGQFFVALAYSLPVWILGAAEVWAVTTAFGMTLPFAGSFLIQALLVIGVAVPTPGGVGSFHEAYRFGMTSFFAAPNASAVAAAIVVHALSFVPVVILGLIFMAQDGLTLGRLRSMAESRKGAVAES
jgi:uncharacterized protein (TIRG00374 family)